VDLSLEIITDEHGGSTELCSEVRMVIGSVEKILAASFSGDYAEETAHL